MRRKEKAMYAATETAVRTWTVDPTQSVVEFKAKGFWGLATVTGRFSRFDGAYTKGPGGRTIDLDVDADSLETGNGMRDRHLRGADFFHVEEHQHVCFTATHVAAIGDGRLRVKGELEAAGRRVPLSFFAAEREVDGELEIEATTVLDQHLVGMTHSRLGMVRRPVTLHVKARLLPARG
jgi:polyisoprenoid-binding protein YceI